MISGKNLVRGTKSECTYTGLLARVKTTSEAADTYFQHDMYGSTLFASDSQGVIRHHAVHDIWGMPETICDDISVASGLRFTTYDYDSVLGKHFRLYARQSMGHSMQPAAGCTAQARCGMRRTPL